SLAALSLRAVSWRTCWSRFPDRSSSGSPRVTRSVLPSRCRSACSAASLRPACRGWRSRKRQWNRSTSPDTMPTRIHLIGICGTAMATLAAMLKRKGCDVRGSDQNVYPPMSEFLEAEQIPTFSGYRAEHITTDLDLVIVGNAISRGNPELEQVLDCK